MVGGYAVNPETLVNFVNTLVDIFYEIKQNNPNSAKKRYQDFILEISLPPLILPDINLSDAHIQFFPMNFRVSICANIFKQHDLQT